MNLDFTNNNLGLKKENLNILGESLEKLYTL